MLRISIIGPESTGKSVLAEALAAHYGCSWIPEYAREYVLSHPGTPTYDDVCRILDRDRLDLLSTITPLSPSGGLTGASPRSNSELCEQSNSPSGGLTGASPRSNSELCERSNSPSGGLTGASPRSNSELCERSNSPSGDPTGASPRSNSPSGGPTALRAVQQQAPLALQQGLIFLDAGLIIDKVWADLVFGHHPDWLTHPDGTIIEALRSDFYLLLLPDVAWVDDPARCNGSDEARLHLFDIYEQEIRLTRRPYGIVSGQGAARTASALRLLEEWMEASHNQEPLR